MKLLVLDCHDANCDDAADLIRPKKQAYGDRRGQEFAEY
jgi:hypothetical protein